jgi:hypothetical protein
LSAALTAAPDLAAAEQKLSPLPRISSRCLSSIATSATAQRNQRADQPATVQRTRPASGAIRGFGKTALAVAGAEHAARTANPTHTEERDRLIDWVDHKLDNLEGAIPKIRGRVVLHRLSRFEYNTIRDLFGSIPGQRINFPRTAGRRRFRQQRLQHAVHSADPDGKYLAAADDILNEANPERIFVARPNALGSKRSAAARSLSISRRKLFGDRRRSPKSNACSRFTIRPGNAALHSTTR